MAELCPLRVPGVGPNELMGVGHGVVVGLLGDPGVGGSVQLHQLVLGPLQVLGPLEVRAPGLVAGQAVPPLALVLQQGENQKYASRD